MKANKIKKYREKAKMTQQELGKKIGATQGMISQYESGIRTPNISTALKLSKALKVDVSCLFLP